MPVRCVSESSRCQPSNCASHILLASVPTELQAAIEMVFTSKFLLTLKTDSSTPSHSLAPVKHVPESPRCRPSHSIFQVLLAAVPAELQAAIKMVFTGEFLLNLKTDISMPSHSFMPIRHVLDFPRCRLSNGTFHILLATISTKLQAAMELIFTGKPLLI
ncbi:hypothetical protein L873DRAFT_1794524 [Choiromyces venosus 120613-1]|uniref:Uncharacterized protein n=1 Tax=Choiromyces venosus 120613-1 TaxID=1336337 RepID=A0A3N4J120_9PEZI|nr:hypothetical protein L873DRAFT_1794524 [Choiromyces venosus 120613-1]